MLTRRDQLRLRTKSKGRKKRGPKAKAAKLGYFSCPVTRSKDCPWGFKMAAVAKATSLFGYYVDSLIYDGYADPTSPETSKDLDIMRNIFKSAVQDSVKKHSESQ